MEKIQPDICEKISAIQLGILRYRKAGKTISLQVKVVVNKNNSLHCVVSGDTPLEKLVNKNVTLIQKDHNNYMYIGGRITEETQKNMLILSINMKKACWFIRRSKGSVTWLQEKCTYLPEMKMAS